MRDGSDQSFKKHDVARVRGMPARQLADMPPHDDEHDDNDSAAGTGIPARAADIANAIANAADMRALADEYAADNARLLAAADRALEEARRANLAKNEFLAAMSHELRTPLNAIAGYCQLLLMGLRGPLTPEQRLDLERIDQNQRHLMGLINSVLNFTKLDEGTVPYSITTVRAIDVIDSIEPIILPQMRAKGLRLRRPPCPESVMFQADFDKVRQILLNLTSNAIKYTSAGGTITISCRLRVRSVSILITDTGIGIPREKLPHVFEPFVQVGRTFSTGHEGVGLGLSISQNLARGMGGDIAVRSVLGKGSTFTITFPRG